MSDVAEVEESIQAVAGAADRPGQAEEQVRPLRSARLLSLGLLAVLIALLGRGTMAAYHGVTDAMVKPVSLSPESDVVLQARVTLSRLLSERQDLAARVVEESAAEEALQSSLALLEALQASTGTALQWADAVAGARTTQGWANLDLLRRQEEVLRLNALRAEAHLAELERSLADGLVRRSDLERERAALSQARVALLQNGREQAEARAQDRTTSLARRALGAGGNPALSTPEMQAQRELSTRTGVELLRTKAELSGRQAHLRADRESLARVEELVEQVKARPVARAIEARQNLAFAPYKEIAGVQAGAEVYRCTAWGLLGCSRVGTVAEVVPGEVSSQDTWGSADRGQYVLLDLADQSAAQARSLRVRPGPAGRNELAIRSATR